MTNDKGQTNMDFSDSHIDAFFRSGYYPGVTTEEVHLGSAATTPSLEARPPQPAEKGFSRVCFSHRTIPRDGFLSLLSLMPLYSSHASARPTSKRPGNPLVLQAPAKVNLFLEVLNKRPDGYHDIATLMVAVTLFDVLR